MHGVKDFKLEVLVDFLDDALLADHGVRMRYHLNMDWLRPDPPACRALAYPANYSFEWRRWIEEGLLDEAVLRSYHHRKAMRTDTAGTGRFTLLTGRDLMLGWVKTAAPRGRKS